MELQDASLEGEEADGSSNLRLPLHRRLSVLKAVGRFEALAALRNVAAPTLAERTLRSALAEEPLVPDRDDRSQLQALDVVAPWAEAAGAPLPFGAADVGRQIARSDFLRTMAGADLHRFIGRNRLMAALAKWWQSPDDDGNQALLIEGQGGIGKSIAVGRFLANLMEASDGSGPDGVFHIDFDRPSLYRARTATILIECIRQATLYHAAGRSDDLHALLREATSGTAALESTSGSSRGRESEWSNQDTAERLVSLLPTSGGRPKIAMFVDSFEQVDGHRTTSETPARTAILLRNAGADVRTIIASRSFAAPQRLSRLAPIRLARFTPDEARHYLHNEAARCGVAMRKSDVGKVIAAVGRSPLSLRMAVALLEREGASIDPAKWGLIALQSPELVQATLYECILQRTRNRELRKIAFPGLLVRRLTDDVVAAVLARPCDLDGTQTPSELMEAASMEGQLFVRDAADPGALRHRQDVRALMLPTIDRIVEPRMARTINEAAVAFYQRDGGPLHRIEELYHRLRLGQAAEVLDDRWIEGAAARLKPCLGEFPSGSRAYLRDRLRTFAGSSAPGRFGGRTADSLRGPVDPWRELRQDARRDLQEGALSAPVLHAIEGKGLDVLDGPLGDIVAQRLLREKRFNELLDGARSLLVDRAVFGEAHVGVLCTAAALLEGRGHLREAQTFWLRASRTAATLDEETRLTAAIGSIRIPRKTGDTGGMRANEVRAAMDLVLALGTSKFFGQKVLAREAAAELSETLVATNVLDRRREAVFELVRFVVRSNEAFPSVMRNRARLTLVVARLAEESRVATLDTLNSVVEKLMFGEGGLKPALIQVLREEVDWTLVRAATE